MKCCHYIVLCAAVALVCACGARPDSLSLFHDAETAYASRNFNEAQALCDTLVMRAGGGEALPPEIACQVALMLVRIGEYNNLEEENTVSAWQSLRSAYEAQPDSFAELIRRLPPEDQGTLMMLTRLNVRPDTISEFDYPDEYRTIETELENSIEP